MLKTLKLINYLWLIVAAVSVIECVEYWSTNRQKAYLFVFIFFAALFMFNLRKRQIKKYEARQEERNNNQTDS